MRRLVLYEDRHWRSLRPLTDLLPVPALAFGASDLARRWLARSGLPLLAIEARPAVLAAWQGAPPADANGAEGADEAIVVNAAALPGPWWDEALAARAPALWLADRRIAGARLPLSQLRVALDRGADFETSLLGLGLPGIATTAELLLHPWELIERNAAAIAGDLAGARGASAGRVHRLACLEGVERIVVEAGAEIGPFAVLDAAEGPIRIASGARVAAHTLVTGPCAVGPGTELLGGRIAGSTFGPQCRVAGEVEASVWQGYANKRHHGFVGHSLVGEWVNLGALTTTSDLKNNYGTVRVWVDGRELESGVAKVGAMLGAHVRTGIGTLLPTGASVGVGANLFGGGRFAPKRVASFAWWDGASTAEHELERFLATARIACARRARTFTAADEALCRRLFEATAAERRDGAVVA